MANYRVVRPHAGAADRVIESVVAQLTAAGYTARKRTGTRVELAFDGSMFAETFARRDHALEVAVGANTVSYVFSSGWALTTSEADRFALEAVVDAAMADVPQRASPTPPDATGDARVIERQVLVARCKFCQQITPVDLEACSHCGAAKFV